MIEYNIYLLFTTINDSLILEIYNHFNLVPLDDEISVCYDSNRDDSQNVYIKYTDILNFISFIRENKNIYTSVYFKENIDEYIKGITFTLTYDNKLIIGFQIPSDIVNDDECIEITNNLLRKYNAQKAKIVVEHPPASSNKEFDEQSPFLSLENKTWVKL